MFEGIFPALITPMRADGAVDEKALQEFVDWQIKSGVHGIVPVGTTGESPTLSHEEHHRVIRLSVEAAEGRVPVIAGTGSNNTHEAVTLTRQAEDDGANAALIVTPYYNKPSQDGLYQHYAAIAQATDLPILIYNIPGRSIIDMSVVTMTRLFKDYPNIIGVKDATADLARPLQMRLAAGSDFCQLSGEDGSAVAFWAQGGHGIISVSANVAPGLMVGMYEAWRDNDWPKCERLRDLLMPIHTAMFVQSSPGPAKYALSLLGKCLEKVRLPITPPSVHNRQIIKEALQHSGLLD
ncbi:MAG: 4-hydroxy-tetrahydrodipicolinate synthase [Pseudomonadota bacterium]